MTAHPVGRPYNLARMTALTLVGFGVALFLAGRPGWGLILVSAGLAAAGELLVLGRLHRVTPGEAREVLAAPGEALSGDLEGVLVARAGRGSR